MHLGSIREIFPVELLLSAIGRHVLEIVVVYRSFSIVRSTVMYLVVRWFHLTTTGTLEAREGRQGNFQALLD